MPATYCPEDDKLRLYVGRVPRDEYDALRKAGFVSTPKQDCDFAAPWTPNREDLARPRSAIRIATGPSAPPNGTTQPGSVPRRSGAKPNIGSAVRLA